MDVLLGLFSICTMSLFFSRLLNKNSSLMPVLTISVSGAWFMLMGIFNVLFIAGIIWYAAAAAALVYVVVKEKKNIIRLFSPGFIFFVGASLFFCILFMVKKPMLIHWDEFTFWGPAAKVTSEANQLYTVAQSNLIARSYPPGLIVHNYMMQFLLPGFSEYKLFISYAVLYMACISTVSPLFGKNKTGSVIFLLGLFFMPFLFETMVPAGKISTTYIMCYADPALAFFFGAVLCFYFSSEINTDVSANGKNYRIRDEKLFLPICVLLCMLTSIKDIGFAFALICIMIIVVDMFFCQKETVGFFKIKGIKAILLYIAIGVAAVCATYVIWALHMGAAIGSDRFDLGNAEEEKSMFALVIIAVKAFLGIEVPEKFASVRSMMLKALFDSGRPVSVVGPAIRIIAFIFILLIFTWCLCITKQERRRVLVFAITSTLGFILFYMFNIFTYTFVLSDLEGLELKDYHRYIYPYLQGWLMCAAALLGSCADSGKLSVKNKYSVPRVQTSRLLCICLSLWFLIIPVHYNKISKNTSNFINQSSSLYTTRTELKNLISIAETEGMADEHTVYLISQMDNGARYYILSYELNAKLPLVYNYKLDENGEKYFTGSSSAGLSPSDGRKYSYVPYSIDCTPEDLGRYLEYIGASHILLDTLSAYIVEDFAGKFEDNLSGWTSDGWNEGGRRYYKIEWDNSGDYRFVPMQNGGSA